MNATSLRIAAISGGALFALFLAAPVSADCAAPVDEAEEFACLAAVASVPAYGCEGSCIYSESECRDSADPEACCNYSAAERDQVGTATSTLQSYLGGFYVCHGPIGTWGPTASGPSAGAANPRRASALYDLRKDELALVAAIERLDEQDNTDDIPVPSSLDEGKNWCRDVALSATACVGIPSPSCDSALADRPDRMTCQNNSCMQLPSCLFRLEDGQTPVGNACMKSCTSDAQCNLGRCVNGTCPDVPANSCPLPGGQQAQDQNGDGWVRLDDMDRNQVAAVVDHLQRRQFSAIAAQTDPLADPYCGDIGATGVQAGCASRDPDYWHFRKIIEDVKTTSNETMPTDYVVVLDTSGSMAGAAQRITDGGGTFSWTKSKAAAQGAKLFRALVQLNQEDANLGIVSFSSTATQVQPLQPVANAALGTSLTTLETTHAGMTSIGAGLEAAGNVLCLGAPAGTGCAPDDTRSRAVVLLTDGLENTAPCVNSGGTCTGSSWNRSPAFDETTICAIGYGAGADASLLDELSSSSPGGASYALTGSDTKSNITAAFQSCFADLTEVAVGVDPTGTMLRDQVASEAATYSTCGDSKLFFSAITPDSQGELRTLVERPDGSLVRGTDVGVARVSDSGFDAIRVQDPQLGDWRAQVIRRQNRVVNGFASNAFANPAEGTELIRRELHRLCPDGCPRVVYYEDGRVGGGTSAYASAIAAERTAGLIGTTRYEAPATAAAFNTLLASQWDLVVFVNQLNATPTAAAAYDPALTNLLCDTMTPVLMTDLRKTVNGVDTLVMNFFCSGVFRTDINKNYTVLRDAPGEQKKLIDGDIALVNRGYATFSIGVASYPFDFVAEVFGGGDFPANLGGGEVTVESNNVYTTVDDGMTMRFGSVVAFSADRPVRPATTLPGSGTPRSRRTLPWSFDIMFKGPTPLTAVPEPGRVGDDLHVSARVLPNTTVAGGYLDVDARAEITYPTMSLQTAFDTYSCETHSDYLSDAPGRSLHYSDIPKARTTVALNDDGIDGDRLADNLYWSASVDSARLGGVVQGKYEIRYLFDFIYRTASGGTCTQHREAKTTISIGAPVSFGTDPTCPPQNTSQGPTIDAPAQSVTICSGSQASVQLNASSSSGVIGGEIISLNGAPVTGTPAFGPEDTVKFPVGVTTVRWTAIDASGASTADQLITVTRGNDQNAACCPAGQRVVNGNDWPNLMLRLLAVNECIVAKGGNDWVTTAPSMNNTLYGGAGNDQLWNVGFGGVASGGAGNDTITAISGSVYGDAGDDVLNLNGDGLVDGGSGGDTIVVTLGTNEITPGPGIDWVTGGFGNDTVYVHGACEVGPGEILDGGLGNDTLVTAVPLTTLQAMGVLVIGFENIVETTEFAYLKGC